MKGVFWQTDDLVIGSFAPQTNPYEFEFPRYGFNNAPSGMMFRGTYVRRHAQRAPPTPSERRLTQRALRKPSERCHFSELRERRLA
jgi:hypothetical protein